MSRLRITRTFFVTMGFFFVIFAFLTMCKSNETHKMANWELELQDIDRQITELEEMKRGYESRAINHENQAQRLQFQRNEILTAKRHWKLAEENKAIAEKIQQDIDQLQKRKQELLRSHGRQ